MLVAILVAIGALNAVVDPFQFFRWDGLYVRDRSNLRLMTAGAIKTGPPFENLVVGSSYTSNTNPKLVTKLFGGRTFVAGLIGGGNTDARMMLEFALRTHPEIKRVFYESNAPSFCQTRSADSPWELPEGVLQGKPLAIVPYLLSLNTTKLSIEKLGIFRDKTFTDDAGDVYHWYDISFAKSFGNATHLEQTVLPNGAGKTPSQDVSHESIENKASRAAGCFLENEGRWPAHYPNVQFYFFNPPTFQWALWNAQKAGGVNVQNRTQAIIADQLQEYSNARVFDMNADSQITNDCKRYMDSAHHTPETDDLIFQAMLDGKFRRTQATNDELSDIVLSNSATRVSCSSSR